MKRVIWWIILGIIILKLSLFLYSAKMFFLWPFDVKFLSEVYSKSQYVIGSASKGIGDDGLYAFAGYYYLFQKGDVTTVNFEHPPLGKYLIGISILLFKNENVINIFYFVIILVLIYYLGKIILKNEILSLIPVFVFSTNSFFLDNLIRSLLDLPYTLFFILGVYFFLQGLKKSSNFYFSSLFWAAAFSTRFFPSLVIIYAVFLIILFIYKRKLVLTFLISSLIIPLFYLLIHFSFFLNNHTFIEFLRHKKWMLSWFTGSPIIVGNLLRNVLTGWYIDSVGDFKFSSDWNIVWALVFLLGITRFRKNLFNKNNLEILVIYAICIAFILYLTFLNIGLLKYLMPIYPLLTILAVDNIRLIYNKIFRK